MIKNIKENSDILIVCAGAMESFEFAKAIELVKKVSIEGYVAAMKCYYIFVGEPLLLCSFRDKLGTRHSSSLPP